MREPLLCKRRRHQNHHLQGGFHSRGGATPGILQRPVLGPLQPTDERSSPVTGLSDSLPLRGHALSILSQGTLVSHPGPPLSSLGALGLEIQGPNVKYPLVPEI